MRNPVRTRAGFTLIELLTVITIIAILASISGPALNIAITKAQMVKSMGEAKGIGMALRLAAEDEDGFYPDKTNFYDEEISTSNDAFRGLFPDYIATELPFANKRSAWGPEADNRFDSPGETLEAGENHFAYIAGLSTDARPDWPLIVDGTNGSGAYTNEPGAKGGAWGGSKAIVVYTSGKAAIVRLKGEGDERFIPRYKDSDENLLDVNSYMGENVRLLDPAGG